MTQARSFEIIWINDELVVLIISTMTLIYLHMNTYTHTHTHTHTHLLCSCRNGTIIASPGTRKIMGELMCCVSRLEKCGFLILFSSISELCLCVWGCVCGWVGGWVFLRILSQRTYGCGAHYLWEFFLSLCYNSRNSRNYYTCVKLVKSHTLTVMSR